MSAEEVPTTKPAADEAAEDEPLKEEESTATFEPVVRIKTARGLLSEVYVCLWILQRN